MENMGAENIFSMVMTWGTPVALILIGYFVGRYMERNHLASLARREAAMTIAIPTSMKTPPDRPIAQSFLVTGSVVIASDYFKTFGANLKTLVGGRLGTLETLVDRGRREAMMRMREQAAAYGAQLVLNVRMETSTITRSQGKASMPSVEVLAYGTAVVFKDG